MLRRFFSVRTVRRLHLLPVRRAVILSVHHVIHVDSTAQVSNSLLHASPYDLVKLLSEGAFSSSISTGEQYHSPILKVGLISNVFVATALIGLYCKRQNFHSAHKLFYGVPYRNVVTWNTWIHGLAQCDSPNLAVYTFYDMLVEGIPPTPSTMSTILTTLSHLRDLVAGIMLHCVGFKRGFVSNVIVGTSLVNMYCKCSDMLAAKRVFDGMPERNLVTWTSLVTGYARHQRPSEAMHLVREMRQLGVEMNKLTYSSLLSSFYQINDLVHGKQAHSSVIKMGFDLNPYITVSLVSMYSKCGSSMDFMNASSYILDWDQVSFNSIIAGFSHLGNGREGLVKFVDMRKTCLDIDVFTFISVLRAVSTVAAVQEGKQTHALILKYGFDSILSIQNALVSMYAKCGNISDSKEVFFSMEDPDLTSWNSLLSGCARHGYGSKALELFEEMRGLGVKPDGTTYLSVLSACSHVGFVKKGLEFFHLINELDPVFVVGMQHYACVVDILGRAGYLDEAFNFIGSMPLKPGVAVYRALLSACQIHGNVKIAEYAAKCLFELCPNDAGAHVLLSNVFAADECWHNAARVRMLMHDKRARKEPAYSQVQK